MKDRGTHSCFFSLVWSRTASTITEATTRLLYQPRIIMDDNECGAICAMLCLAGETEVLPQCCFVHHISQTSWAGFEPSPPRWEAGD
jgi:hypothetical protein